MKEGMLFKIIIKKDESPNYIAGVMNYQMELY